MYMVFSMLPHRYKSNLKILSTNEHKILEFCRDADWPWNMEHIEKEKERNNEFCSGKTIVEIKASKVGRV